MKDNNAIISTNTFLYIINILRDLNNVKPVYNPEYDFINTYVISIICYTTRLSNHIHDSSYINIHPILHVKLT